MNEKSYKILKICFVTSFIAAFFFSVFFPPKTFSSDTLSSRKISVLDNVKNGDKFTETFISRGNYTRIGFKFGNYEKILKKGSIVIKISDEKNNEKKYNVLVNNILDNEAYYVNYKFKKGNKYSFTLIPDNLSSPITFYTTSGKIKNANLKINDEYSTKNLYLTFLYPKNNYFVIWYILLIYSLLLIVFIWYDRRLENDKSNK